MIDSVWSIWMSRKALLENESLENASYVCAQPVMTN